MKPISYFLWTTISIHLVSLLDGCVTMISLCQILRDLQMRRNSLGQHQMHKERPLVENNSIPKQILQKKGGIQVNHPTLSPRTLCSLENFLCVFLPLCIRVSENILPQLVWHSVCRLRNIGQACECELESAEKWVLSAAGLGEAS